MNKLQEIVVCILLFPGLYLWSIIMADDYKKTINEAWSELCKGKGST